MKLYDTAIIGAGPAGLFAANELSENGLSVLVVDKGRPALERKCPMNGSHNEKCAKCSPCNIMCGIGGAGGLSDGKLNFHPDIGGYLKDWFSESDAWKIIGDVDKRFEEIAPEVSATDSGNVEWLQRKAFENDILYIPAKQKHMGSDRLPEIMDRFRSGLEAKGIRFLLNTEISYIEKGSGFIIGNRVPVAESKNVICCAGRSGSEWMQNAAKSMGLETVHGHLDIGVRVEVPAGVMEPVTNVSWCPKFIIRTSKYDDRMRTFCTCPYGFVSKEDYGGFVGVNGHSMAYKKSQNTNFAFLNTVRLTEPLEDTSSYGRSIAKLMTTIGGGKPTLQRLGDLQAGRRSTWERIKKSNVEPTLTDVTPGDISMGLPQRTLTNITEGLEKLDRIIPGVASSSTLLYAPEIKFYATRFVVGKDFQTNVEGLFVAGDGAGLSRGIVGAAATGLLAARGVMGN